MDKETKRQIISAIENDMIIYPIVKEAFTAADTNSNGTIERSELETCLLDIAIKLGCSQPDKETINKEFKKLDEDKNGKIDFKEFQKLVKKNLLSIVNGM